MRVLVNDVAILERAGFDSSRCRSGDGFLFVRLDEAPFHAAGKTGAAAGRAKPEVFTSFTISCATS